MLYLLHKFLLAITPTEQELRIRGLYRIRLGYRLRMFWRFTVKQYFCKHSGETYVDADWTYTKRKCSRCHKTLRDLRKDPE
jgi:hypothetical protein